jgi:hypothetical protein
VLHVRKVRISARGSVVAHSVFTRARGLTWDSDLTDIMESILYRGVATVPG